MLIGFVLVVEGGGEDARRRLANDEFTFGQAVNFIFNANPVFPERDFSFKSFGSDSPTRRRDGLCFAARPLRAI